MSTALHIIIAQVMVQQDKPGVDKQTFPPSEFG